MAGTEDEGNEQTPKDLREQLKKAKARAAEADELRAEIDRMRKDTVIRDTGLNLSDKQRAALLAVHEGDLTPDGLKATASALWPQPTQDRPAFDPSLDVHDRISEAVTGEQRLPDASAELDAKLRKALADGDEREFDRLYAASGRQVAQQT